MYYLFVNVIYLFHVFTLLILCVFVLLMFHFSYIFL